MIRRKNEREIGLMRRAGNIAARALALSGKLATVGTTTGSIDKNVREFIISHGAQPVFKGYRGFPANCCISVNEQVIHGIPSSRKLADGDIVSIDVGARKDGFIGDCAATFVVGRGSEDAHRLVEITRQCFFECLKVSKVGYRISDISAAIENYALAWGYNVVKDYVGHGVGSKMHEDPEIPNFVQRPRKGADPRLMSGMTLAIEPMLNAGVSDVKMLKDGWTVVTADGKLSAHYEHTILITGGEPEILTVYD